MLDLFDLVRGEPVVKVSSLLIPELKAIWDADESPGKEIATLKLAYIYHVTDPESAYSPLAESDREAQVAKAFVRGWEIGDDVNDAVKLVREAKSPMEKLYENAKFGIDKIGEYLRNYSVGDENIDRYSRTVEKLRKLAETYTISMKAMQDELATKSKIKGTKPSDILVDNDLEEEIEWD